MVSTVLVDFKEKAKAPFCAYSILTLTAQATPHNGKSRRSHIGRRKVVLILDA